MSQAKAALHKHRKKGLPVLGAAGLSLCLGSGAPAALGVATTDIPACSVTVTEGHTLREEEFTDITLATFHIFDREEAPRPHPRIAGRLRRLWIRPLRSRKRHGRWCRRRRWRLWIRLSRQNRRLWEAAVVAVVAVERPQKRLYAVCRLQKGSRQSRQSKHLSDRKSGPKFPNIRIKTLAEAGAKRTLGRQMKRRAEASAQRAPGQQMKTPLDKLSLN